MSTRKDRRDQTIPVLQEKLQVGKRKIESDRVVLRKTVKHQDEVVESWLRSQSLRVERVAIGRVVSRPPALREEGPVLIVPVLEEKLVVEKQLILREELRIHRTETTKPTRRTVRLRREEVAVERPPSPPSEQEDQENGDT